MSSKRILALILLSVALEGFTCGTIYPPVVMNVCAQPVDVTVLYATGDAYTTQLQPGARLWAGPDDVELLRISVKVNREVLFELDGDELDRLRARVDPGDDGYLWEIAEDGVTPRRLVN